jgi:hydroxyacylglutathione hydrolase
VRQLADGVWQLSGFPPNAINVYLVEDVLIDAGTRHARRRILRQLRGHNVAAHALTHVHPDHQGASSRVCEGLSIPFFVPVGDAAAAENPALMAKTSPDHLATRLALRYWAGPGRRVDRALADSDEVAGFRVIDVPGHTPGHVTYWRESDRVLILGDVLNNLNVRTGIPGLHEPPWFLSADPAENRRSARRLLQLEPRLVLFGHGAPLRDTNKFSDFIARLPG